MNLTEGKPNMDLYGIEAYALPSSSYVQNDSHVFAVSNDREKQWCNHGGGWHDSRPRTKVAETQAYKEWLFDFVPPENVDKCGIGFYVNGVCQTYANRELLIGQSTVNVSQAPKNYVCLFFFGKYGYGLKQLKKLLTDSYNRVTAKYNDPYNALNTVLQRVDDYLDDELKAWRQVGIEYGKIPIDEILAKSPSGGLMEAKRRLQAFIDKRESIYQQYLDQKISRYDVPEKVQQEIINHTSAYLDFLKDIRYITDSEKSAYEKNIQKFVYTRKSILDEQMAYFALHNSINTDLLANRNEL